MPTSVITTSLALLATPFMAWPSQPTGATGASPQSAPPPVRIPAAVRLLDLDGDGGLDKLYLGSDGSLRVARHLGGRSFEDVRQDLPRVLVSHVLVDDLDGDGSLDLLLVSSSANVALRGDGRGQFWEATAELGLSDAGDGLSAERLDLDEDGYADVLLHNRTLDVVFWACGDGTYKRDADAVLLEDGGKTPFVRAFGEESIEELETPSGPVRPSFPGGSLPLSLDREQAETIGSSHAADADARSQEPASPFPIVSGTGTPGALPRWLTANSIGDSALYENPAGDVSIGATNPQMKLDVLGTATSGIRLEGEGGNALTMIGNATYPVLNDEAARIIAPFNRSLTIEISGNGPADRFSVLTDPSNGSEADTETLVVRNDGRVGIGTTSPTERLTVAGVVESTSGGIKFPDGSVQMKSADGGASLPSKSIILWFGTVTEIPQGWALCDGQNGTPDLRDRFVLGTSANPGGGSTGGSAMHSHSIPNHSHGVDIPQNTTSGGVGAVILNYAIGTQNALVSANGHNHTYDPQVTLTSPAVLVTNAESSLPPYYKLIYIMKL